MTPNPAVKTVDPHPVIETVLPEPAPSVIVTVPPDGVRVEAMALILTNVPPLLLISGLAAGKDVSLPTGTKPPVSSKRSMILLSIA